jgi:hypothetical protein
MSIAQQIIAKMLGMIRHTIDRIVWICEIQK